MGTGLLTDAGFSPKTLADVRADLEAAYRAEFGQSIDLSADSTFGKEIGILSGEFAKLWEQLEGVRAAHYPGTASGASLDGVAEFTAVTRNPAVRSAGTVYCLGALTTIPAQSLIENASTGAQFRTTAALVLPAANVLTDCAEGAGNDLVQAAGVATLTYPGHSLGVGDFIWGAGADQAEYNIVAEILSVAGDDVTFAVDSGATSPATGDVTYTQVYPVAVESVEAGPVPALAGTLTVIVSSVSGWDEVTNAADVELGALEETDAEFRTRRLAALAGLGNATLEAIRGALQAVEGVELALVYENDTDATVSSRPPHSFEAVVEGGDADDIRAALFANKAAGIETYGSTSGTVVDSQGVSHTIKFSRPADVDIWLDVTLTVDGDYPADGDAQVLAAILAHAETLDIGEDVIVQPYLVAAIAAVEGITDVVIDIGTSDPPSGDSNITISEVQRAAFDSARIGIASS